MCWSDELTSVSRCASVARAWSATASVSRSVIDAPIEYRVAQEPGEDRHGAAGKRAGGQPAPAFTGGRTRAPGARGARARRRGSAPAASPARCNRVPRCGCAGATRSSASRCALQAAQPRTCFSSAALCTRIELAVAYGGEQRFRFVAVHAVVSLRSSSRCRRSLSVAGPLANGDEQRRALQQGACPREARHHGADRDVNDPRDIAIGQLLQLAQDQAPRDNPAAEPRSPPRARRSTPGAARLLGRGRGRIGGVLE